MSTLVERRRDARDRDLALVLLALSFAVRLVWVVWLGDPFDGDDARTYLMLADQFREHGLLSSEVIPLPYWPAGYPIVIATVLALTGSLVVLSVLQLVWVTAAGFSLWRLASRTLGNRTALVAVAIFAVHPTVTGIAGWYGYEPLLLAALVIGTDLVHDGCTRSRIAPAAAGFALIGIGATLQPKAIAVGGVLLAWVAVSSLLRSADGWPRRVALVAACGVALSVGPGALMYRNGVATGHAVLSTNGGANLVLGNSSIADGKYTVGTKLLDVACDGDFGNNVDRTPEQERVLVGCALDWIREHPLQTVQLWPKKLWYFSGPMTGPLARTQHHGFDVRRVLGDDVTESATFHRLDTVASATLFLLTVLLGVVGAVAGLLDRSRRTGTLLVLLPVVVFAALAVLTIGGSRHRAPIVPFLAVLQAQGVVVLATVWRNRARLPGGGTPPYPRRPAR